jgi:methionyl aminopeptidase
MSVKTLKEFQRLRAAGKIARKMLEAMKQQVRPGITTEELDAIGAAIMHGHGARSAPKLVYGFPGTSLISVNDQAVHGIPGHRVLCDGDLVKLDVTIEKDGFMADAAETVAVGAVSQEKQKLIACARQSFRKATQVARAGNRIKEIGRAIEYEVRRCGFSVIRELCGHGIGRTIHEEPSIPNFPDPYANEVLTDGLVITIEPIITAGSGKAVLAEDGWTIRTTDCRPSAHYEHTLMITRGRPILFTAA